MDVDVNGVKITLTQDQLDEISRQTRKKRTVKDITDYEVACDIISRKPDYRLQEISNKYWAEHVLETMIEAANYIDNGFKRWTPDFEDTNEYKYIPYFEKNRSGWVASGVLYCFYGSEFSVGLYFKKEETAKLFMKTFINTYKVYLG
jgi:hypothetical protein